MANHYYQQTSCKQCVGASAPPRAFLCYIITILKGWILHVGSSCLVSYLILSQTSVTTMACKALGRVWSFLQEFVVILPAFSVLVMYSDKYDGSYIFTIMCSCMIHLVWLLCWFRISLSINSLSSHYCHRKSVFCHQT